MTNTNKTNNKLLIAIIAAIVFVTYNVVLFALCGFEDHGGAFWISYVFMMIAFLTLSISTYIVRNKPVEPTDWLLGYSVIKHCVIYLVTELVASVAFIILDYVGCPWAVALVVQLILFAVHLVFVILCFMAKDMVEDIDAKVEKKTSYIRLLTVDVEMIAERATDSDVKAAYTKLAEQIRFSDPMSNEALAGLEAEISSKVALAKSVSEKDAAIDACNEISLLITERNKKCKVLK